jgi:hypothetical protein
MASRPREAALRQQICRVGRSLFERGYVHATAGNISVRLDDGFLITPTDACLGTLDPAAGAAGCTGVQTGGDRASKTLACTGASTPPTRGPLRHPHAQHAPGGADAAGRVEQRRHPAAHHALLRDEGRAMCR